jgi:multisubunit Na+/H+ antiporter MnhB subunit
VVSVVLQTIAPRLLGPALMVAAALIVKGYTDVGDGFGAGVIVALAVGLQYLARGADAVESSLPALRGAPVGAVAGLMVALAVGFLPVVGGDPPFTHYPPPGQDPVKIGTLELITAVGFDLGLFLLVTSVLVMLMHHLARLVEDAER